MIYLFSIVILQSHEYLYLNKPKESFEPPINSVHQFSKMTSRRSRIPPSKHQQQASDDPPSELTSTQHIGRVAKTHGNALYSVELPSKDKLTVELPMRFRNAVWVRRGGFVLIDTEGYTEGKVGGEIKEVIRDEKAWRKMAYWFITRFRY